MAPDRVRDLKVLLDRLADRAEFDGEPTADDQVLRSKAIGGFVVGGTRLLDEATPFIWAYNRSDPALLGVVLA